MYKVGDRVKILGQKSWHRGAKADIGKLATVTEVQDKYLYGILVDGGNAYCKRAGNSHKGYTWLVLPEAIKKVSGQMVFPFMLEGEL